MVIQFTVGIAIMTILIIIAVCIILFKAMTFEEVLFDERVKFFCEEQKSYFEGLLEGAKSLQCDISGLTQNPSFDEVK